MTENKIITLTTDFGADDWFVGTMKGVILKQNPKATIVDITHGVQSGDICAGAFALAASYNFFPRRTVHLAVVDPGVGSQRPAIAVRTTDYYFVGPDNGVLALALAKEKIKRIVRLQNDQLFLKPVSSTFHGRDIFAPVAAHLSIGIPMGKLGPAQRNYVRLDLPKPKKAGQVIAGQVVYIDKFGNAITNIGSDLLAGLEPAQVSITAGGSQIGQLRQFYSETPPGQPLGLIGSTGFIEIAINGGAAAQSMGLKIGDTVEASGSGVLNIGEI